VETHRDIEADVQIALPASTAAEGNYDIIIAIDFQMP
jgi:hypothetical protein